MLSLPAITFRPIGVVHSPFKEKVDAPRQPSQARDIEGHIELFPKRNFEHALFDIQEWDYIWVIFCFHLNDGWRPKVLPPRSGGKRKGLFSTRSPHRPNPIGLSAVKLQSVSGLVLNVRGLDIVDGSPVLDIKPYVPYADAIPDARSGWLDACDPEPSYSVVLSQKARSQADWLKTNYGIDFIETVVRLLSLGPQPHPYRRIRETPEGTQLAHKEWRIFFSNIEASRQITLDRIVSGYRPSELEQPENAIHAAYEKWRSHSEAPAV